MQELRFLADVRRNRHVATILDRWDSLALPDSWLVAGCLFQTVWNLKSGQTPEANIKDYDVFYFDSEDLSVHSEQLVQDRANTLFQDLGIAVEVANQARVHHWYEAHFGHPCAPLLSSRDGIERFLIPATCVGVQPGVIYAPFGLELLYAGRLDMNPLRPHRDLYERKAASYQARWPWLTVAT